MVAKVISIVVSIIIILVVIYSFTWSPLDKNGFPKKAKVGDIFTKGRAHYTLTNNGWTLNTNEASI